MRNLRIRNLLLLFLCMLLLISGLHIIQEHKNSVVSGFTRRYFPHAILGVNSRDMAQNIYYISGMDSLHIYLSNTVNPTFIYTIKYDLKEMKEARIQIGDEKIKSAKVVVLGSEFYLLDGISPLIMKGYIDNWVAKREGVSNTYFSFATPISRNSIVMKVFNRRSMAYVIAKSSLIGGIISKHENILERQIDGIFCTDGMFHANLENHDLFYVYYYRNQFIRLDTNLNVISRYNTIDTVSIAQISVSEVRSQNSITLSSPPLVVNKNSSVYKNNILIHSDQPSVSENMKLFRKSSIIDVYSTITGDYKYSFHILDRSGHKVRGLRLWESKLIVLQGPYLTVIELNKDYLDMPGKRE